MPGQRGPVPVPLKDGHRDITQEILNLLDSQPTFKTSEAFPDVGQIEIKAALDRLASRSMIEYETKDAEILQLTDEAEKIVAEGSHEWKVWDAVKRAGKIPLKELPVRVYLDLN
jgi:phenylalanyl-tRNA synthetase alpha chain